MTVDIIFRTSIKRYMDDIAIFFNDDSVIDNPESASHLFSKDKGTVHVLEAQNSASHLFSKELDLLGLMSHNSSSSKGYPSQTTRALFRCSVSIHKIRVSNQKMFARDRGQKMQLMISGTEKSPLQLRTISRFSDFLVQIL